MRYKLDSSGYVCAVAFGSYLDNCIEYTGKVPSGYKSLEDWASNSLIQAYYIDLNGDLTLDFDRKIEIENKAEQEAIDNACVLRKDIFDTEEAIEGQYIREIASGKVIVLQDIKTIAPKVKITGITGGYEKLRIHAHGKNMMPCHAQSCFISGVTFTKNMSGSITILGTSTEPIEYVIADGKDTTLFALKSNEDYFLNLGGLQCELSYFDGETTAQQYIGASGLLNLPEHIEVTKVVLKIASGDSLNTTFYPQLEYGNTFTSYESHKLKALEINIGELEAELVLPSDDLHPDDELYPGTYPSNIEYVLVENGKVSISVDGKVKLSQSGSMGLFSAYNTIYATKDVDLEIEYSANFLLVDSLAFLQGKSTTTDRFKILEDGSIEAKNGYFSGRIEADSGYFKGTISWSQIPDASSYVTTITKNTVTTAYVNALNVTAGSVKAENIIGDYISGRTISGSTISGSTVSGSTISGGSIEGTSITIGSSFSVDSLGTLKAYKGEIAGLTISSNAIYYGKTSLSSTLSGVYVGKDGISVGAGGVFRVTSSGDVHIKADITSDAFTTLQIGGSTGVYADYTGIKVGSSSYAKLENNHLKFSGTGYIEAGYTDAIYVSSATTSIMNSAIIGGSGKYVGFFGKSGSTQKSISTLSSSDSSYTIANKVNEIINALRGYGLLRDY